MQTKSSFRTRCFFAKETIIHANPLSLSPKKGVRESDKRLPLVVAYRPLNSRIKQIFLNSCNILISKVTAASIPSSAGCCISKRSHPERKRHWLVPHGGTRNLCTLTPALSRLRVHRVYDTSQPPSANISPVNQRKCSTGKRDFHNLLYT